MNTIKLSDYELNLVLTALAKLPYEQSGAVIQNIMEQMENEQERGETSC